MHCYPNMEKKSNGSKMDAILPNKNKSKHRQTPKKNVLKCLVVATQDKPQKKRF